MTPAELRLHRRNTEAFIKANPIDLALIPRVATNSGTGQSLVDQQQRPVQRLRLIDQSRTFGPEPGMVRTSDGQQRKAEFQLLGEHDAVIGLYDYWKDSNGILFEVAELLPRNGYEVRAQVVCYGQR